jgi:hypothetical protein
MATVAKLAKPEAGTVHWLNECIERGKREVFSETIQMNPGLAAVLLQKNPDNRHLKPIKSDHFTRDMMAGRWVFNGEPIIVAKTGELNDGQHRLNALIDANITLPMVVTFGVSRESRVTVDQGSARSASDYLAMQGYHYANNASTAAKFIIAYERSGGRNLGERAKITNAEVVARVKTDEGIIASTAYAWKHYKEYRHLVSLTVMAACHYVLSAIHPDDAEAYLNQVCLGENIKRGDPAFAVRSAFLAEKRERQPAMEIIFHGWNKFRSGSAAQIIRVNNTFPALG